MKKILLIALLFNFCDIVAQNLVLNPSFEEYENCENWFGGTLFALDWDIDGTPDYFNSCTNALFEMNTEGACTIPLNFSGYQYPREGNAYVGIDVFESNPNSLWSEYIIANFSSVLEKDSLYMINFWVSRSNFSGYYTKQLSACLSDTLVYDVVGILDASYYIPQISNGATVLSDTVGWTKVCGLYRAKGGEKYLIIGNFGAEYPNNSAPIPINTTHIYITALEEIAYYYIDDVSVEKVVTTNYEINLGSDTIICANPPYNITLNAYKDYFIDYIWSTGETTSAITIAQPGTYWVQADLGGCYLFDMITIQHPTVPPIHLQDSTTICAQEFPITLAAPIGYDTYLWSNGNTTPSIVIHDSGTFVVIAQFECGTASDTIKIEKENVPEALLNLGEDTFNCENEHNIPVTLISNIILPNYLWSTGDTTPSITVSEPGIYWLRSTFLCGELADSITLLGCPPNYNYALMVPTAFSPNNDGVNDKLSIISENITLINFSIYNRWGQCVFETNNIETGWEGMYKGQEIQIGTYVYSIEYLTPITLKKEVKKGFVTLIR